MKNLRNAVLVGDEYPLGTGANFPKHVGITVTKHGKVPAGPTALFGTKNISENEAQRLFKAVGANAALMDDANESTQEFTEFMLRNPLFKLNLVADEKGSDRNVSVYDFKGIPSPRLSIGKRVGVDLDMKSLFTVSGMTQKDIDDTIRATMAYHAVVKSGTSDTKALADVSQELMDRRKVLVDGYTDYVHAINKSLGTIAISLYLYDLRDESMSDITMEDTFAAYPSRIAVAIFNKDKVPDTKLTIYPMKACENPVSGEFGLFVDIFYGYSATFLSGYRFTRGSLSF